MKLHLLVNISSDTENLYGAQFVSSFLKESSGCEVTLFHICRLDSSDSSVELTKMWEQPDTSIEGKLTVSARRSLDKARQILDSSTISTHQMKTKMVQERFGKVNDILSEGASGLYDALILGRRASYALQWFFDRPADEIPQALIQHTSLVNPLWICCEPEPGRKNILLCVDGSANALRAADHVGYILSFAKHHNVTVFHVETTLSQNTEELLQEAVEVLLKHGIETHRISCKSSWGVSVSSNILSEKQRGEYAAVAVGLHGQSSSSMLENLGFLGGTTSILINKIVKSSLWCCP